MRLMLIALELSSGIKLHICPHEDSWLVSSLGQENVSGGTSCEVSLSHLQLLLYLVLYYCFPEKVPSL